MYWCIEVGLWPHCSTGKELGNGKLNRHRGFEGGGVRIGVEKETKRI